MNTNDITCGDIFALGSAFAQCHASTAALACGQDQADGCLKQWLYRLEIS